MKQFNTEFIETNFSKKSRRETLQDSKGCEYLDKCKVEHTRTRNWSGRGLEGE